MCRQRSRPTGYGAELRSLSAVLPPEADGDTRPEGGSSPEVLAWVSPDGPKSEDVCHGRAAGVGRSCDVGILVVTHGLVFPILGRGRDTGKELLIEVTNLTVLWPPVATREDLGRPRCWRYAVRVFNEPPYD